MDPRSIWLVTRTGSPWGWAWAMTAEDAVVAWNESGPGAGDGIKVDGAEASNWRHIPECLQWPAFNEVRGYGNSKIKGRILHAAGCTWDLDDDGFTPPLPDMERLAPAPLTMNKSKLQQAMEARRVYLESPAAG